MIKVFITQNNILTNEATFSSLAEANAWIKACAFPTTAKIKFTDMSAQVAREAKNKEARDFLNQSDWRVLKYLRQKALGLATDLTEDEYIALEMARQQAAEEIV